MLPNNLPVEANHSSLDLFEKPSLLVTFDTSFEQKVGPLYAPNGPTLEFEVVGDRTNFIDLQNIYLEVKCRILQANGNILRYDATDANLTDSPCFVNNILHSRIALFKRMASKFRLRMVTMNRKLSWRQSFPTIKKRKTLGWDVKVIPMNNRPIPSQVFRSPTEKTKPGSRELLLSLAKLLQTFFLVTSIFSVE